MGVTINLIAPEASSHQGEFVDAKFCIFSEKNTPQILENKKCQFLSLF